MTVLQALTLVFHIFQKIVNLLESLLLNSTRLNCLFCVSYLGACYENLLLPNYWCRVVLEFVLFGSVESGASSLGLLCIEII
jgi:hypothetical protein